MNNIIQRVISSGIRIANTQIDESDLTLEEQKHKLSQCLSQKPHIFLEKYHSVLDESCCSYFDLIEVDQNQDVIDYFINAIRNRGNSGKQRSNRRYAAMNKLSRESDFFSESSMRSRDPEAFDMFIGQFLTNDELNKMITEPSSIKSKSRVDILLDTLDEQLNAAVDHDTNDAGDKSTHRNRNDSFEEEFDSSDDENDDTKPTKENVRDSVDPDDCPMDLRRNEFVSYMKQKFLDGKEPDVDYVSIDSDDTLDCSKEKELDDEEAYFDAD